ncbi:MAG: hypothetical protein KC435_04280 [Thermomicrobiales bacterium]|nr:hypothetical protein [Thermomicrobiales bacterium]
MERIFDLILDNIGITIFLLFTIFGVIGRGDKKKAAEQPQQQPAKPVEPDGRPLVERMAEYFGVDLEQTTQPAPKTAPPSTYASDGRRSPNQRNVQQDYPDLFGGGSLFSQDADAGEFGMSKTKWGFDETEWGSTFEKSDEQWGHSFPEKKSSEPVIEWPQ